MDTPDDKRYAELARALQVLAYSLREATERLLDLQQAVEALHVARTPALTRAAEQDIDQCLSAATRSAGTAYQWRPWW